MNLDANMLGNRSFCNVSVGKVVSKVKARLSARVWARVVITWAASSSHTTHPPPAADCQLPIAAALNWKCKLLQWATLGGRG